MQERVVDQGEAERAEPSWYLTRDGKQYGPLTDRELSLFAKGGNFKDGDLLWTAGLVRGSQPTRFLVSPLRLTPPGMELLRRAARLSTHPFFPGTSPAFRDRRGNLFRTDGEPADAVLGLMHESNDTMHPASEPPGEAVNALVQALTSSGEKPKPTLKEKAIAEAKKFAGIFVYLWVVFTALLMHEWVVLSDNHIGFTFYGLAAINAVVLAKIMFIADNTRFAERFKGMPLVYPIVYKAVAFTTLLFAAYVLEEMLVGGIAGRGFLASVPHVGGGLIGALALWLVFCLALIPYFAFREIERAVGPEMFRRLLFGNMPARR